MTTTAPIGRRLLEALYDLGTGRRPVDLAAVGIAVTAYLDQVHAAVAEVDRFTDGDPGDPLVRRAMQLSTAATAYFDCHQAMQAGDLVAAGRCLRRAAAAAETMPAGEA